MRAFLLLLATLFCFVLPPALHAQEAAATTTITAEDSRATDAAIATRLREILTELTEYSDVTVSVSAGIVTFRGTTLSAEDTAMLDEIAQRISGVVTVRNEVTETSDIMRRLDPVLTRLEARWAQFIATLPILAVAAGVFVVIVLLGFFVAGRRFIARLAPNAFIADIYRMLVRLAFVVAALVVSLDILNATALLSTILGAAGIIGLAVGFAVRDTVENFIASIMLSIRQPFRPNDAVEINGDEGLVIRLTSRATILLSFDGNHIRIPNATVFKSRILNYSTNPQRRFLFEIGVASGADLAAMRSLAEDTVRALPYILDDPAPLAWTDRIGDGAVFLKVTGWIDQRETNLLLARSSALRKVKAAIEATGVEVPDTTYRIALTGAASVLPETQDTHAPATTPGPETDEEEVDIMPEALERIAHAEQEDDGKPNLLRDDAAEE